jgi:dGTPase
MSRMNWRALLRKDRFSTEVPDSQKPPVEHPETRVSTFQEDIDRICYSAAFRRLQGKTQVLPFPKSDFTRTRLTHTIEVCNIAKQICSSFIRHCKDRILQDEFPRTFDMSEITDVVTAACFAHDLGNPPFGHVGEYAVQQWVVDKHNQKDNIIETFYLDSLPADASIDDKDRYVKTNDLRYFDGNPQGFRLLTRLQGWRNEGGLQLSVAVLGAFSKYPNSSMHVDAQKKFGFMFSERHYAKRIFTATGLPRSKDDRYYRHPLAFIVEAADDIAYHMTDLEDAFKEGVLSFSDCVDLFKVLAESGHQLYRYSRLQSNDYSNSDRIAYLRGGAISALISHAASAFAEQYEKIMTGELAVPLLERTKCSSALDQIKNVTHRTIYTQRSKNELEVLGCVAIEKLLDEYLEVLRQYIRDPDKMSVKQQKLFDLLPHDNKIKVPRENYDGIQYIIDFVSSMTDRHALDLFRKLSGIPSSYSV